MERVKIDGVFYEITEISKHGFLLDLAFEELPDLIGKDLSIIEVFTSGGVKCTELSGFNTIYHTDGSTITLSNNGAVYSDTSQNEPVPSDPYVPSPEELLSNAKRSKLSEVASICQGTIYEGTDITTSKGTYHYSLTLEDQTNISYAYNSILNGASEFPYHADGRLCEMYSAVDITTIANESTKYKLYHTTYCNHLNVWINRCSSVEEVNAITYGISLPEDLQANFIMIVGD